MERLELTKEYVSGESITADDWLRLRRDWLRLKAEVDRQAEKIKWLERCQAEREAQQS